MPGIIVGHDGSQHAHNALARACALGRKLGEKVTVVRAYGLRHGAWPDMPFGSVPTIDEIAAHTQEALERDIAPVREVEQGVTIEARAIEGKPAAVLIEASRDALVLVVARRGLGGFDRLMMGSVSEQVVAHAHCDVLVTRD